MWALIIKMGHALFGNEDISTRDGPAVHIESGRRHMSHTKSVIGSVTKVFELFQAAVEDRAAAPP